MLNKSVGRGAWLAGFVIALVAPARAEVKVGDKPELSSIALDNRRLSLADFRGRIVIVDFWATWSSASLRELAALKVTYEKHEDDGVAVLGVCLDEGASRALKLVKEREIPWPSVMDQNGVSERWGVDTIPTRFVIGPDGQVLWTGFPTGTDEALEDALKKYPPKLVDAKTLDKGVEVLAAVDAALKDGKLAVAYRALAGVPVGAKLDKEFRKRLTDAESRVSTAGDVLLAGADGLVSEGKFAEAVEALKGMIKSMSNTPLAEKARAKLDALGNNTDAKVAVAKAEKQAKLDALLAAAKKFESDKNDDQAYLKYKDLARAFPKTSQGDEAGAAVKRYEADAEFMKRRSESSVNDKARSALSLAKSYVASGRTDSARKKFQEVIDQYPDTSYAKESSAALKELK